ncbi:uncharacterized protein LOC110617827 [Manihot esculenta]|uniref:uncharacterized protein LOC110617827 n=1 Tax=Manihot esculenta TaxID=3983 RepID=UPI000B5D0E64|nr:uncharacterized protein LOC110617827 [Manihot esculenta]
MKAKANRRDPDKYCQYHRTYGHDTNNCYQLINEIERLIKRGHLRNFVKKPEGQRPQQNVVVERPHNQTGGPVNDGSSGMINMIVGGIGGRMSRKGKKRSRMEKGAVCKILVDDGSKVNLLPYRVFQQMNIPEEQLVRDRALVKEIGGTPMVVEEKVKVALTLGEPPLSGNHYIVFLMVKQPLNYNAILGRPMLYDFEVVTSIRYLTMKFPIESGVGIVRGRQEEAQAVYLATVEEPGTLREEINLKVIEVRDEKKEARTEPVDKLETFPLSEEESDKVFNVNASLEKDQKETTMALIRGHASSFA